MKEFLNGIIKASGEQWFGLLCIVFLASLAVMIVVSLSSDHKIRCYYMKSDSMNTLVSYKVMGDVDWGDDITVFIGNHPSDSIAVMSGLKQCGAI